MVTEYYPGEKEFGEHLSSLRWWEREPTQQVKRGVKRGDLEFPGESERAVCGSARRKFP
jgi:hypothetical protein